MPRELVVENEPCLNCQELINGSYCQKCGQRAIDNVDRSMTTLVWNFFGNLLFLDNRFFISLKYLLLRPGKMTYEFLQGKRRKFLPPITLFLFANLIYFFLNPITDFSLPLHNQVKGQPFYSVYAKKIVDERLLERGTSFDEYAVVYNSSSDNISKTVMILNVPMIALFIYLVSFKKRKFYFDSLVFSFHFFSFFLLSVSIGDVLSEIIGYFIIQFKSSNVSWIWFMTTILIAPFAFLIISFRRVMETNWLLTILAGMLIFVGMILSHFLYRGIIFFLTFYST